MLSTNDFAQRVWVSLEDIRERMAVLETEFGHIRGHLEQLEAGLNGHIASHHSVCIAGHNPGKQAGPSRRCRNGGENGHANDASITIRLSRRALGGGGLLGGSLAGLAAAGAKALGWW